MSFATDAKSEIMRALCEQESAVRCEMNAAFLLAGSISFKGAGRYLLSMSSESAAVARYCFTQVRRLSEIKPEIQTVRSSQLGDHTRYRLELSESDSALLLDKLGLLDPAAFLGIRREPPTLDGETERVAWLRGAFLATGWVAAPEKAYNVEFALSGEDHAEYTARLLNGMGIRAGVSPRKSQTVVYVKDFEGVSRLLALMGAFNAYMACENIRIVKQLHNGVNRQLNCDESNTDKTVRAAENQIRDINFLRERGILQSLPRTLQQMAEARVNNPDANLTELGELLDPPIGKSGVNNRLRRLSQLAREGRE